MARASVKENKSIYQLKREELGLSREKAAELLQFIWRSNVRVKDSDQPVYVYIPDRRMRELLYAFMEKAKVNASVK